MIRVGMATDVTAPRQISPILTAHDPPPARSTWRVSRSVHGDTNDRDDEFRAGLAGHRAWLESKCTTVGPVNLNRVDLRDHDLWRLPLYRANLFGADLRGAYLSGAFRAGADRREANLYGATMRDVDLRMTDLT